MKRFIKSATTSKMLDTFEDGLANYAVPKRTGYVESATDLSPAYYNWEDEYENGHPEWERVESKDVLDFDGFWTKYSLWYNNEEDLWVTVFGDYDIYHPWDSDWDMDFDSNEKVARDWFESYTTEDDDNNF